MKYCESAFSKIDFNYDDIKSDENKTFPVAKTVETSFIRASAKTLETSAIFMEVPFTLTPRRKAQYFKGLKF